MKSGNKLEFSNRSLVSIYLHYAGESDLDLFRFEEICERYQSDGFRYVTGLISLESLQSIKVEVKTRDIFLAEI